MLNGSYKFTILEIQKIISNYYDNFALEHRIPTPVATSQCYPCGPPHQPKLLTYWIGNTNGVEDEGNEVMTSGEGSGLCNTQ
jgi:hypothetical protein